MSIDTKEYAQLAARVYATTPKNELEIPSGWSIVGTLMKDQSDGFSAGVFRKGSNEIVIAYTGTNADKLTDILAANVPAALGFYSSQVLKAMKLYIDTRIANPTASISFTGHSLGGGLASLMAVYFGKPATTFDAAPFQASAVSADAFNDEKRGALFPVTLAMAVNQINIDGKPIRLAPGMNVTAEIKTGKRRVIDYLLTPVQRAGSESLRER